MAVLRYLSHPQVAIDPNMPVPDWPLSDQGRARIAALADAPWLAATSAVVSSAEVKARETAAMIAAILGLPPRSDPALNEIDRSSTGYVPHDRHEALADAFFADPQDSAEGWERASDVQRRGMTAIRRHVADHGDGDLLIIGHGGIGTMCWCALSGDDPRRRPDQPAGGGAVWAASLPDLAPIHAWQPMERVASAVRR
ncbi:histidine phosphatase family protein [Paracoccus tegillarcae]|uniref:Histidine phosphatase family protein n=1 Tax=Paracoccus tegillarcae TaxID=1529068 RepID=A0A2K9EYV9_9RHOB|nr:histidine phosphatase family protein [Paracoccus tegillarcae]AUH33292.1 histidine phosphatase family protein [Paracoccus tegillarcae]